MYTILLISGIIFAGGGYVLTDNSLRVLRDQMPILMGNNTTWSAIVGFVFAAVFYIMALWCLRKIFKAITK